MTDVEHQRQRRRDRITALAAAALIGALLILGAALAGTQ